LVRKRIDRERRRETRQPGASTDEDYEDEEEQMDFYQALQTLDKASKPKAASPRQFSSPSSGSSTARSNQSGAPSPKSKEKEVPSSTEDDAEDDEDDEQSMDFLTALRQLPAESQTSPRQNKDVGKPSDDTDNE
jgi:hypothetical protein